MRRILFVIFISLGLGSFAQNSTQLNKDSLHEDTFLNTVEQSLNLFYNEYANDFNVDSLKKAIEENNSEPIKISDDDICKRLGEINAMTPFQLDCMVYGKKYKLVPID